MQNFLLTRYNVSHETFSVLEDYVSLLSKWNKKINLVSKNDLHNIWERHILDSVQLVEFIDVEDHVIDVGSGAGLPGLILAVIGVRYVTLVESDKRKAAFLLQASRLTKASVKILNARVENVSLECDILVSRGFASIENMLNLCKDIKVKKKILLLKGSQVNKEIDEAKISWNFDYDIKPSITDKNGCIVELIPGYFKL